MWMATHLLSCSVHRDAAPILYITAWLELQGRLSDAECCPPWPARLVLIDMDMDGVAYKL